MLTLNLEALGVSEAALEKSILSELGLTREEAVKALAAKFGVPFPSAASTVSAGDLVQTDQGESKAAILTQGEADCLKQAGAIAQRIFG